MATIQIVCAVIVASWIAMRCRGPDRARVLRRLALLAIAAWIGEESCIRLYGYYFYAPGWALFVDRVPLLIPMIWPVVVQSAHDLAASLLGGRRAWIPLAGAAIVLADASLMEPIAVRAGLWSWSAPGLFSVPPIGILGWAFFAAACIAVFERAARPRADLAVIAVGPLATHALLVAAWWGAFRWIQGPIPSWPAVAIAWALSLALAARAWRTGARRLVPPAMMWIRVPPSAFFFALLVARGRDVAPLVAYAIAFAPPYLALTAWPEPARATGAADR